MQKSKLKQTHVKIKKFAYEIVSKRTIKKNTQKLYGITKPKGV